MTARPPHLCDPLLAAVPHGFFGRRGGVSEGAFESLNVGRGSKDNPAHVTENRARIGRVFGVDDFFNAYQVHSARIVMLTDEATPEDIEGDAVISTVPGRLVGVLTADCAPVLMADARGRAVAAVHAGWRGAVKGIVGETVAALEGLGIAPSDLLAVMGPMIAAPSYEVGGDMKTVALAASHRAERFFTPNQEGRYQFDLPGFVEQELRVAGVEQASRLAVDTYTHPADWFSARYGSHQGHADYGRNAAVIMLPPRPR